MTDKLKIDPEFKLICPAHSKEEYELLEESISKAKRVHDAIVVWNDTIVDGHNRYEIANRLGIKFNIRCEDFRDRDEAKCWIILNQLSRRNLKPKFVSLLRARIYLVEKKPPGGDRRSAGFQTKNDEPTALERAAARMSVSLAGDLAGQNDPLDPDRHVTANLIGDRMGVSEKTVRRDVSHLKWVESLHPNLRALYEGDILDLNREELKLLSSYDHESQLYLYNQVKLKKFKSLKDAIAADEVEASTSPQIKMEEESKLLRSWATRVRNMIDELPDSPWIDETTRSLIHGDLKSAGKTALSRIGGGMCPKCNTGGCKTCRKTGWLPKMELEQVR